MAKQRLMMARPVPHAVTPRAHEAFAAVPAGPPANDPPWSRAA